MHLRILLPITNIIIGAMLFCWGDMQVRRIAESNGGARAEGITDVAAEARYVHYALNAPAWALLGDTREKLWSPSTYWYGRDLGYLLAVAILWFLIGSALDKRIRNDQTKHVLLRPSWAKFLGFFFIIYGMFVCYSTFPSKPDFVPLKDHIFDLIGAIWRRGYGWWFYVIAFGWAVGLMSAGLALAFRAQKDGARRQVALL
jgi:hypothetical protein